MNNNNNNNMKRRIRLTEGDLHRIIRKCVNEALGGINNGNRMVISYSTDEEDFELFNNGQYDILFKRLMQNREMNPSPFNTKEDNIFEEIPYKGYTIVHCDYLMDEAILLCKNM